MPRLIADGGTGEPTMAEDKSRAFQLEVLPRLDTVHRVALALARDPVHAEDLVQETMLKAYRSWHQYQSGTNVRAWLLTILRNNFVSDHRREQHRRQTVDFREIEEFTVFEEVQDIGLEDRLFNELVDDEVLRAIHTLPTGFRETLVLRDVEDLSYAEVAQVTGVRVGTVKSRLFRARQALQRQLYDYAVEMGYIRPRVA